MSISVIICNGCCCGRVEKGHNEVPIDKLEAAWEANRIGEVVKLTISDCLGPCSMHNVSLLNTGSGKIWLGELVVGTITRLSSNGRLNRQRKRKVPSYRKFWKLSGLYAWESP